MNQLDVLFICDGSAWTAQCLQYDISAQGESLKDAQRAFEYMISVEAAYLAEQELTLDNLPAAPQWYWSRYQESLQVEATNEPTTRFPRDVANLLSTLVPMQRELRVA